MPRCFSLVLTLLLYTLMISKASPASLKVESVSAEHFGDRYCMACYDSLAFEHRRLHQNILHDLLIVTNQTLESYQCNQDSARVVKCSTSCLEMKFTERRDSTSESEKTGFYLMCSFNAVRKLPGFKNDVLKQFHGQKTIIQQLNASVQLTLSFLPGFISEQAALANFHLEQFKQNDAQSVFNPFNKTKTTDHFSYEARNSSTPTVLLLFALGIVVIVALVFGINYICGKYICSTKEDQNQQDEVHISQTAKQDATNPEYNQLMSRILNRIVTPLSSSTPPLASRS